MSSYYLLLYQYDTVNIMPKLFLTTEYLPPQNVRSLFPIYLHVHSCDNVQLDFAVNNNNLMLGF